MGEDLPALGVCRSSSPWGRILEGLGAPGVGARAGRGFTLLSRALCQEPSPASCCSQQSIIRKAFIFPVLLGYLH